MKKTILSVILILTLYGISYAEVNKDEKSRVDIKKFLEENSISSQENNIDDNVIKEFYNTGELKSETPLKDGIAYTYFKSGKISSMANIKNGKLHGKAVEFYDTGEEKYTGTFINGKTEGLVHEYYKNGNIKSICMYKNDKKEGVEKEYKEDGKTLIKETNYKNGKKHGIEFTFYENGAVKEEFEYINGEDSRNTKTYYDTGVMKTKHVYDKKSKLTTIYGYNENGKLSIKSSSIYGVLKEGLTYFYNEDGSIGLELLYKNDELISGKCGNGRKLNNAELRNFTNGLSIQCY